MDDTDLRPVGAADRSAWGALWTAYLLHYDVTLPPEVHDAAFARLMSDDPEAQGLIAWRGAEALGLVHWIAHAHLWRPTGAIYLQDLYVAPDARGAGLGARLIEAVYADADRRGVTRVHWLTEAGNASARRLYDRVGVDSGFVSYASPNTRS